MKKIFSVLLAVVLTVVSFGLANGEASAATATNRTVALSSSEPTDSTTRVVANYMGSWSVVNTGKYNVSFRIFKNGDPIGGYTTVAPGVRNGTNFATTPGAGYSLRIYCNSPSGTGCGAAGVIANYKN
ncbi:hypothetical protein HU147_01310 [Planomicrobium chinense]|uniref:hypothetical protein n=1 Tax=Planococcus chinensis TaxID=272917 RepID=UPI001CC81CBD|nr:hypothetical protein [Planococcus chinensis]MBZ5199839.1 hypothetical protein [Planococcus chinensis]